MKSIILFIICMSAFSIMANAQTEKFDIASFTPPTGWEKQVKPGIVAYTTTEAGSFCIISIFNSQESLGDAKTDFNNRWKESAVETLKVTAAPVIGPVEARDGWSILLGSANFQNQGGPASFFLQTFSGFNKTVSVVAITNSKDYLPALGGFLASIKLDKPSSLNSLVNQSTPISASRSSGITISKTNFSDGWTATVQDDYVLVNKGDTNVYLFWSVEYTDESRNDTNKYFWRSVVLPRFNIQSSQELEQDSSNYFKTDFVEGTGTNKQTGQSCYVAMRVVTDEKVGARIIVASAPNRQSYYSQFPNPENLGNMLNSNRFALTANDVFGYWKGLSSEGVPFYNRDTGAHAGMKTVVNSDEFTFNSNGTFLNSYAGSNYNLETLTASQSKTDGNFSVTNWELTITDKQGETTIYDAYFEAVKGGRILRLTNRKFTGMQYKLVKIER